MNKGSKWEVGNGEDERSKIRVVQMNNLRGLVVIRTGLSLEYTDKGVVWSAERIDEGLAMWREWRVIGLLRGCM